MNLPLVANRTPDMYRFFEEGEHWLAFDGVDDGVAQVEWALANYDDALEMAHRAHKLVKEKHTWDIRMEQVLKDTNVI